MKRWSLESIINMKAIRILHFKKSDKKKHINQKWTKTEIRTIMTQIIYVSYKQSRDISIKMANFRGGPKTKKISYKMAHK